MRDFKEILKMNRALGVYRGNMDSTQVFNTRKYFTCMHFKKVKHCDGNTCVVNDYLNMNACEKYLKNDH